MRHITPTLTLRLKQLRCAATAFAFLVASNPEADQLKIFVGGAMTEAVKEVDGNRSRSRPVRPAPFRTSCVLVRKPI